MAVDQYPYFHRSPEIRLRFLVFYFCLCYTEIKHEREVFVMMKRSVGWFLCLCLFLGLLTLSASASVGEGLSCFTRPLLEWSVIRVPQKERLR